MGHSGSVQRGSGNSRRQNPDVNAANHANYTPAQLQALYLTRGRPDMGFMSNQTMAPKDVPEMQQTCTVKNHVNLKKSSLQLVAASAPHVDRLSLEFVFDATKPCRVTVLLLARETIDDETGCSRYALQQRKRSGGDDDDDDDDDDARLRRVTRDFPEGLAQLFRLEDALPPHAELLDLGRFDASELAYEGNESRKFPLLIVLEVLENGKSPQSQATFCTFVQQPTTRTWSVKMLKQKVQVDGLTYELQEIYGIDGSLAAAPKHDASSSSSNSGGATATHATSATAAARSAIDDVDLPDGAECIICLCEPRTTTVLPCRHMCLCSECADALRKGSSTCPICRTHVESLLQIRVEAKDT